MILKKVYIAGKITGLPTREVVTKFQKEEMRLRLSGYEPINPVEICKDIPSSAKHSTFMKKCIAELAKCDYILLLPCWKESKGAKAEEYISRKILEITEIKFYDNGMGYKAYQEVIKNNAK